MKIDRWWLTTPAIVLLGYLLLILFSMVAPRSFIRGGLAVLLALFGSGCSAVTILYQEQTEADVIEKLVVSANLSLAIGGILGYLLALSPWRLNLTSLLVANGLFNLGCLVIVLLQGSRKTLIGSSHLANSLVAIIDWWRQQNRNELLITIASLCLILSGAWALGRATLPRDSDPPMTEFYLLDRNGQISNYPKTVSPGESFEITCGISNWENIVSNYRIRAYINDELVSITPKYHLDPDETRLTQMVLTIPEQTSDAIKIQFTLYREEQRLQSLYLFLAIENTGSQKITLLQSDSLLH